MTCGQRTLPSPPPPPPLTEMLYTHELGFHFSEPKPQGNLEAALPAGVGGW